MGVKGTFIFYWWLVSSSNVTLFSFAKNSVNLNLLVKLWISFSISIVFLRRVIVNFKPLLKTLTCVSIRHVLDKFMTLGSIIVCLFDWCELHPVHEIKNYLRLRHLIVDIHLSLMYQVLLQFDFVAFLLYIFLPYIKCCFAFCCFEGRLNLPNLCLFKFLLLCWFLIPLV